MASKKRPEFVSARVDFHAALLSQVLFSDSSGVASNADRHNKLSVNIASGIATKLKGRVGVERLAGQTSGSRFEDVCMEFVRNTFLKLDHLRPGKWTIQKIGARDNLSIAKYEQYSHLIALSEAARSNPELAAALGNDYTITPDIVVARQPEPEESINQHSLLLDQSVTQQASLRQVNNPNPLLHASISCKWTIRSDRVQSSRSEALNLIRNRKGRLPHIVVITGEPTPSRLAAIALGTGDIDCVYHFALYELQSTLEELDLQDALDLLKVMTEGKRLKDISDLPLDLAV